MQSDLLQLYDYIKYCLHIRWSQYLRKTKTLKDMQHDIFLYLVDIKGIKEFNPGSKRYAYLLAQYYPDYLRKYKYSRTPEIVILNEEGGYLEQGISYFAQGDIDYDLRLLDKKKINKKQLSSPNISAKPILVQYQNGEEEIFYSIKNFCDIEGCDHSSVYLWIKNGMPQKWGSIASQNQKYKYRHIKSVSYMSFNNPFNGSRTIVKKVITEKTWEERKDKEDFDLEDENEYYKLFIHKESKEGLLVKIKNPKGAEFYLSNKK